MDTNVKRILIVDDNPSIHDDIKHVLVPDRINNIDKETMQLEHDLFSDNEEDTNVNQISEYLYDLDNAFQGEEAIKKVEQAEKEKNPYTLIFMDVRMPPGIDGIQTIREIWDKYPYIEMVICTAYSDYTWDNIISKLGSTDQLFFMKKPFDSLTVKQMAFALSKKWESNKIKRERITTLENEIEKRTDQVKNMISYFEKIKEESEKSKIVKNNFLMNMGCEIQTPLNGIMGMTDMLLDTELSSEQRNYAKSIRISRNSLSGIIDDILSYSRIENSKVELANIEFNIRSSIENLVDILTTAADDKGLDVATMIDASIPETLIGDPLRLRQILLNFINNAIESTESGYVLLSATCKNIDKSSNSISICFEVSDTGKGLSKKEKEKLFLPVKEKNNDKNIGKEQKNTGLVVCKQLCELMNGTINIISKINKGSTFQFTADFIIEPSPKYKKIIPSNSAKDIHCLVISDNPVTRKVLNLHINQWGARCGEATNKKEAIEKLNTALGIHPYDIAIVDFNDADITLYEDLVKSIKRFKNLEFLKLVGFMSKPKPGDAKIFDTMGYSAYFAKPIKQSHLYKCLLLIKGMHEGRCDPETTSIITKHMIDEFDQDYYRALIIGDNSDSLKNLLCHLYRLRIRCDVARNEDSAVYAYENCNYDLVFIDCSNSSFNGIEIIERINDRMVSTKRLPVIGITNDLSSENKAFCQKAGVIDIVNAPFEKDKIILILKNSLKEAEESKNI